MAVWTSWGRCTRYGGEILAKPADYSVEGGSTATKAGLGVRVFRQLQSCDVTADKGGIGNGLKPHQTAVGDIENHH